MERDAAAFQIGDFVSWRGRLCVLRGIDPMSVRERRADIEDCVSGDRFRPPVEELEPPPASAA